MGEILVTGALGNVGSAVVDALDDRATRVAGRSLDRLRDRFGSTVRPVRFDFEDESTFAPALVGVDGVFLIRPPSIARVGPTVNEFIRHAARHGVRHIVFSSVAGADRNRILPHNRIERCLLGSGVRWTILRPGFFTQNLETAYRGDIVVDDRIHVPASDAQVAFVDTRDVGEVAAAALTGEELAGSSLHLTGPEAMTFDQVASVLTVELGREITYEPASVLGYLAHLRRSGTALPQALVQTILHADLRRGTAAEVTGDVERVLGRPATGIGSYIARRADVWDAHSSGLV